MSKQALLVALVVCGLMAEHSHAVQPAPLPVFQVVGADGAVVQSDHLVSGGGQWLLLYIQADCRACEAVLQLIKQVQQHPNLPRRLVIIGGMNPLDMNALAQKYPDLSGALWTTDTSRNVFRLLKLAGTPTVLGIRGQTVQWSVNGVLKDTQQYKEILESWTN